MAPVKKYRLRYGPVAADLFTQRSWASLDRPVAIVLPGLPDFAGPTALTSGLLGMGCAVLQPHLLGTYDSDGVFSPDGCRETLTRTWDAIVRGELAIADSAISIPVRGGYSGPHPRWRAA